jgi:hypothetical protein
MVDEFGGEEQPANRRAAPQSSNFNFMITCHADAGIMQWDKP